MTNSPTTSVNTKAFVTARVSASLFAANYTLLGAPCGSGGKASAGDMGLILGPEDPLEENDGNPLQYSRLKTPRTGSLAGYHPWGRKGSDVTERSGIYSCLSDLKNHLATSFLFI